MRSFKCIITLVFILFVQVLSAQKVYDFSEKAIIERLKKDVYTLSSEEMEGREAGTEGERRAAAYIKEQMQQIGLQPMFGDSYLQEFTFPGQWVITPGNFLSVGGRVFYPGDDYSPMPVSGDATVEAPAIYLSNGLEDFMGLNDYKDHTNLQGKIFFIEYYIPVSLERESGLREQQIVTLKLETALSHGAAGVVFINTQKDRPNPRILLRGNFERLEIPVVFGNIPVIEAMSRNPEAKAVISTRLERERFSALNVGGYLNNNAPTTVVIGGHYDHLGMRTTAEGERVIYFGADDNASGTAGVLEAARYLINSDLKNNNYIFLAFTAEEKGLIGSRYFTDSDAYDMGRINYMFNYDMIGRLENNNMALIGTGTSPSWDGLIDQVAPDHFNIRKSPGGMGGSDHSAFYMKDIPVIFFYTGSHQDYHRPSDTPDKVNFEGSREILAMSMEMISRLDKKDRLEFSSTPVTDRNRRRSETIALGLVPDITWDGQGLMIQAVMEERPAKKAGLMAGDVIVAINDTPVQEIQSYMGALENLRAGEKIRVRLIRKGREMALEVQL